MGYNYPKSAWNAWNWCQIRYDQKNQEWFGFLQVRRFGVPSALPGRFRATHHFRDSDEWCIVEVALRGVLGFAAAKMRHPCLTFVRPSWPIGVIWCHGVIWSPMVSWKRYDPIASYCILLLHQVIDVRGVYHLLALPGYRRQFQARHGPCHAMSVMSRKLWSGWIVGNHNGRSFIGWYIGYLETWAEKVNTCIHHYT